ncbi:MAG: hypothetical protein MJZ11_01080 [Lachnospiraceae bacterium]|nr:hypothetical protein [Lachnospiraceae bacterium]
MQTGMNKGLISHENVKSYKNFNVAVYMPVHDVLGALEDLGKFSEILAHLTDNVNIGRVYIENYRSQQFATKEQLIEMKKFFEARNIACSGGITTCDDDKRRGFASLCYSNVTHRNILESSVQDLAEVFDEIIFDDFYFLNCRCEDCIRAKGNKTWSQFRLDQKKEATENLVIKIAHKANPDCNVIVKYPQWFESFNETGYDLKIDTDLFDSIYTGTETRNPNYAQQHLPKYLSYFIMRYFDSVAPDRNLGGWFDPYECTYNLSSYLEQGYLTLFGKAKEATLFCLSSLIYDSTFRIFAPAVGEMFRELDSYLDKLGNPVGLAAYRPHNGRGEDNVHSYLGMCGIPFEPSINYDDEAKAMFLAEGASYDDDIVNKMKKSLHNGADVIVTSGFVRRMGEKFEEFANVTYSSRKALVNKFADSKDHGLSISGSYESSETIIIPQMDCYTNDVWTLAAAYGTQNNFPVVLRWCYDKGRVCVVVIPDNMGDLYHYPNRVLNVIRGLAENSLEVSISAPALVQLFLYDNDVAIVRSDLDYCENVTLNLPSDIVGAKDLVSGKMYKAVASRITFNAMPNVNYVFKFAR